jgi:uncharacterized Zn finger protein
MFANYIYCDSCGYEDFEVVVVYSRTTASGALYICPSCREETSHVENDE